MLNQLHGDVVHQVWNNSGFHFSAGGLLYIYIYIYTYLYVYIYIVVLSSYVLVQDLGAYVLKIGPSYKLLPFLPVSHIL